MNASDASQDDLLKVTDLTKRYAVKVLDRCALQVRSGEIHGLLGANGAGKSTLCKIVAGLAAPTSGTMMFRGERYAPATKQQAETLGIQIVQQELELVPTLSVAENLAFGQFPARLGVIRRRALHQRARAALDRFGLSDVHTEAPVSDLGVGRQQMVEIAKALDRQCRLLILDEPTAALSGGETATLFRWLRKLRSEGVGLIYISHRLEEVSALADRITVLRDGRCVATRMTHEVSTDQMVALMSGTSDSIKQEQTVFRSAVTNDPALEVKNLCVQSVRNVSFTVHRGERLGIAGLVGSGRTELLRAIFGADRCDRGQIRLGQSAAVGCFSQPAQAVEAGIAMVTEDRRQNGLLLPQSIRCNTTLATLWKRFSRCGVIRGSAETQTVQSLCREMETRCNGIEQSVATLSGGNQQKVAVSKWLLSDAKVFLFDEPTRGIDVAARRRIYAVLQSLAEAGKGIVVVSSDLEELFEICDRIAVMSNGRLVQAFDRDQWTEQAIMQAAFSGYADRNSQGEGRAVR